ncbi:hypothetical protein EDB89DRAFT_568430 [Lactarius sanguifluus]|nr:hypothetical protein EDB89DRAFT_568430 [Lactarius sanguifluus]
MFTSPSRRATSVSSPSTLTGRYAATPIFLSSPSPYNPLSPSRAQLNAWTCRWRADRVMDSLRSSGAARSAIARVRVMSEVLEYARRKQMLIVTSCARSQHEHPFFVNRYESVQELEDYINGILYVTGKSRRSGRVSFGLKLCLCPSDLNRANFKKVEGNRIVALDFGGYSFLPPSFAFVLDQGDLSGFTDRVARRVVYPPSTTEVAAMVSASCALVPRSSNDIGLSEELESRLR